MRLIHTHHERGSKAFFLVVVAFVVVASSFVGGVAAYDSDAQTETDLSNGDNVYQGQSGNVTVSTLLTADGSDDTLDLYRDYGEDGETWKREYVIADDGSFDPEYLEIDTSGLEDGEYSLVSGGSSVLDFNVREQDLTAEWDTETIANVDGDTSNTTVEIDSSRSSFLTEVSADGLDGEDLDSIFAGQLRNTSSDTGEDFVVLENRGTFDANFAGIEAGEYEFTFSAADTDAETTATIDVEDEGVSVGFGESSYVVERSNVAEITVEYQNTDTAYVRLGDESDLNYEVVFKVVDSEDEGSVPVKIDTTEAHTISDAYEGLQFYAISSDSGSVEIVDVVAGNLAEPISAGDYELSVGAEWNVDGNEEIHEEGDTTYLTLEERSELESGAVSTRIAPDSVTDWDSYDATTVTTTDTVAAGDELLVVVETDNLFGFFDGEDDMSDLRSDHIWLEIEEHDSGPNTAPYLWTTNGTHEYESDPSVFVDVGSNVRIVNAYQPSNEVILGIDYDALPEFETNGVEYDVYFVVGEQSEFADEEEFVGGSFTVEERTLAWTDSAETAPTAASAALTGETNVAPGTEISTRARAPGTFAESADIVVEAGDGSHTFEAVYDFSAYDAGTTVTLTASEPGGAEDAEIETTLVEPDTTDDSSGLSVSIDDVTATAGGEATLSATVTAGGEAVTGNAVITVDGDVLVDEDVQLESGASTTVTDTVSTADLAVGDHALEVSFGSASATATLTVQDESAGDGDGDAGSSDGAESEDGSADDSDSGTDDDGIPGFGVAVALVALLGGALLSSRQRD